MTVASPATIVFVSRHRATDEQRELAASMGCDLAEVGDMNAYYPNWEKLGRCADIAVVSPALAAQVMLRYGRVWVFENASREPGGAPEIIALWLYKVGEKPRRFTVE